MSPTSQGGSRSELIPVLADDQRFENGLPNDANDEIRNAFVKYCIANYFCME